MKSWTFDVHHYHLTRTDVETNSMRWRDKLVPELSCKLVTDEKRLSIWGGLVTLPRHGLMDYFDEYTDLSIRTNNYPESLTGRIGEVVVAQRLSEMGFFWLMHPPPSPKYRVPDWCGSIGGQLISVEVKSTGSTHYENKKLTRSPFSRVHIKDALRQCKRYGRAEHIVVRVDLALRDIHVIHIGHRPKPLLKSPRRLPSFLNRKTGREILEEIRNHWPEIAASCAAWIREKPTESDLAALEECLGEDRMQNRRLWWKGWVDYLATAEREWMPDGAWEDGNQYLLSTRDYLPEDHVRIDDFRVVVPKRDLLGNNVR